MIRLIAALAAVLAMTAVSATAWAIEGPCRRDLEKHCAKVEPGEGRLLKCFEEHKSSMSAACIVWVEGVKLSVADLHDVCAKDIATSCNSDKGDILRLVDCLQGNYVSLQPDCRDEVHKIQYRYPQKPK